MKICIQCNIEKTLSDFYIDKRIKDGYRNKCKSCVSENNSKWRNENREKVNLINKNWRDNNPDLVKEYHKVQRGKENRKEYLTKWKDNNPDYFENYYKNNKDTLSIINKNNRDKWLIDNPDYMKNYYENNKEEIKIKRKEYQKVYKHKYNKMRIDRRKDDHVYNLNYKIGSYLRNTLTNNGYSKKSRTYEIIGCSFEELKLYLESKFEDWMTWENKGLYNGEFNYGWDIDHIIPISAANTEEELLNLWKFTNLQPLCSKINRDIKKDRIDYKNTPH